MYFRMLYSSSKGNSALLSEGETHILIDAGGSARRISLALKDAGVMPQELTAIVITHDHTDHIAALPQLLKKTNAAVYAPNRTADIIREQTQSEQIEPFSPGDSFTAGSLEISTFPTPHDAYDSAGYVFRGEAALAYATDTGYVTEAMLSACLGVDMAVIEANHDRGMLLAGRYPQAIKERILSPHGHLSNDECGEFAVRLFKSGTGRIVLAHLSEENNTPALALRTVGEHLFAAGAAPGMNISVTCAPARSATDMFEVVKCYALR